MIASHTLLIFFRLFNFAVLIGLAIFAWRKYGRDAVRSEFEKERDYLASLFRTQSILRQEDLSIQKEYQDDESERSLLRERLFMWRDAIQKEENQYAIEKEQRVQALEKRLVQQVNRVNKFRLYDQIKKDAVRDARNTLKEAYDSDEAQHKVLDSIIAKLSQELL